jgi:hypothetical protein
VFVGRTREAADEHARRLHREAVAAEPFADANPFRTAGYAGLTSFPPDVFRDWLRDEDIDPPPAAVGRAALLPDPETAIWAEWWDAATEVLSESQQRRVWDGLNLYCLYEVVEVEAGDKLTPAGRVVYAVVCRNWQYDDNVYYGANEVLTVFRTRARAEAEAKTMADEVRKAVGEDGDGWEDAAGEYVVVELALEEG